MASRVVQGLILIGFSSLGMCDDELEYDELPIETSTSFMKIIRPLRGSAGLSDNESCPCQTYDFCQELTCYAFGKVCLTNEFYGLFLASLIVSVAFVVICLILMLYYCVTNKSVSCCKSQTSRAECRENEPSDALEEISIAPESAPRHQSSPVHRKKDDAATKESSSGQDHNEEHVGEENRERIFSPTPYQGETFKVSSSEKKRKRVSESSSEPRSDESDGDSKTDNNRHDVESDVDSVDDSNVDDRTSDSAHLIQ